MKICSLVVQTDKAKEVLLNQFYFLLDEDLKPKEIKEAQWCQLISLGIGFDRT